MNPEEIVIKRAAAGDKAAYEKLVEKYKGYVFAIVLNLTQDRFHAENIAQDVFLQVYISLPRYRHEGFRTWLGRIAARKAIDWKRKHGRTQAKERPLTAPEQLPGQGKVPAWRRTLLGGKMQEELGHCAANCRTATGRWSLSTTFQGKATAK